MKNVTFLLVMFLLFTKVNVFTQTEKHSCGFKEEPYYESYLASKESQTYVNTSMKTGLLLVQFADWQDSLDSRGSVGWKRWNPNDLSNDTIINKYRYRHYWDPFFSLGTYSDSGDIDDPPVLHPDAESHGEIPGAEGLVRVYGSFKDYWWEVSHKNLWIEPAVTHPAQPQGSIFRTGIINRFNPDSTVIWVTLPYPKSYYKGNYSAHLVIPHAIAQAQQMYQNGQLDVDITDTSQINKVLITYAGTNWGMGASTIYGDYTVSMELYGGPTYVPSTRTTYMAGFSIQAHEFGHTLGFWDLHNQWSLISKGVGMYSLMGWGCLMGNTFIATHLDPFHKLKSGWMNYEIIDNDTVNKTLTPVADTSGTELPTALILKVKGEPRHDRWYGGGLEYFILENRATIGFDRKLSMTTPISGLILWQVSDMLLPNENYVRVIEADADLINPNGHIPNGSLGERNDFFPGPLNVTKINHNTIPSLKSASGKLTYLGLSGIRNLINNRIGIDTVLVNYDKVVIEQNTTWSGTIMIDRDIIIKNNSRLTLQPGSQIIFEIKPDRNIPKLEVLPGSELYAEGTSTNPILFKSASDTAKWEGLVFRKESYFQLKNIEIRNAQIGMNASECSIGNRTFEALSFVNCNTAMSVIGNYISFTKLNIQNSSLFIHGITQSAIDQSRFVTSNIGFGDMTITNSLFDSTVIYSNIDNSTVTVRNSRLMHGSSLTIGINTNVTVENNYFRSDSRIRFDVMEPGMTTGNHIIKNNLFNNFERPFSEIKAITVDTDSSLKPHIINNTIAYYRFGVYTAMDKEQPNKSGQPFLKNNIFYLNALTSDETNDLCGIGTAIYNDIYNVDNTGAPFGDKDFNFSSDPLFTDTVNGVFYLRANSPCIDAGDPADDFQFEPEPSGHCINMGHHGNTSLATQTFNRIVSSDLTEDETWDGYVIVSENISTNGNKLTVSPGTKVYFENEKSISIDNHFLADGSSNEILFSGYRPNDIMHGIIIGSNASAVLKGARFEKAMTALTFDGYSHPVHNIFSGLNVNHNQTGVYLNNSELTFVNSMFENNRTALFSQYSTLNVHQSIFNDNVQEGMYLFDKTVFNITNNQLNENGFRGVFFNYCSDGYFDSNLVIGNGYSSQPLALKAGLVFYQSSPRLSLNRIINNTATGILSLCNSFPMMNRKSRNLISNNGWHGNANETEISVKDFSFPLLTAGHNDIMDEEGGFLIYGDEDPREIILDVSGNYWGSTNEDAILRRLFRGGGFNISPIDENANVENEIENPVELLFARGYEAEQNSDWTTASSVMDSVIDLYPATVFAKAALDRLWYIKLKSGIDILAIKTYFDNRQTHPDAAISSVAKRLPLRCLTAGGEYTASIENHDEWRNETICYTDSVYSSVDIETNVLLQSGGRLAKAGGSILNKSKALNKKITDYKSKTDETLSSLFSALSQRNISNMPKEFSVSQNYPNPFNPTTTIKYQLPFDSKVTVKIYNILGQEVTTLINKPQAAGYYSLNWNGKSDRSRQVTSGVYIYRIVARSADKTFVKSKKMMLIK